MYELEDIPEGPKTLRGILRLIDWVLIGVLIVVVASILGIPFLEQIGSFVISNSPSIAKTIGFVYIILRVISRYGTTITAFIDSLIPSK